VCAKCPPHLILFDFITLILWDEEHKLWSPCSRPLSSGVAPYLLQLSRWGWVLVYSKGGLVTRSSVGKDSWQVSDISSGLQINNLNGTNSILFQYSEMLNEMRYCNHYTNKNLWSTAVTVLNDSKKPWNKRNVGHLIVWWATHAFRMKMLLS
jgi:hypothetical protein